MTDKEFVVSSHSHSYQCKCSVSKLSSFYYRCSVCYTVFMFVCALVSERERAAVWCTLRILCAWKRRIRIFYITQLIRTSSSFHYDYLITKRKRRQRERTTKAKSHFISYHTHTLTQRVKHGIRAAVVISSSHVHVYNTFQAQRIYYLFNVHRCTSFLWFQKK